MKDHKLMKNSIMKRKNIETLTKIDVPSIGILRTVISTQKQYGKDVQKDWKTLVNISILKVTNTGIT